MEWHENSACNESSWRKCFLFDLDVGLAQGDSVVEKMKPFAE